MCRVMRRTDAQRQRTDAERRRWFRGGKGRVRAVRGARRCPPCVPRTHAPLRPVNVHGHRAKGMRAPENTNQFLMTEKYRLHALRSDSVDSGSDSDAELTDMDTYLGAWEDAHGALLDPDTPETLWTKETPETKDRDRRDRGHWGTLVDTDEDRDRRDRGHWGTLVDTDEDRDRRDRGHWGTLVDTSEDSIQYFPSEDDLILSDNFMDRDFTEFCHIVTS